MCWNASELFHHLKRSVWNGNVSIPSVLITADGASWGNPIVQLQQMAIWCQVCLAVVVAQRSVPFLSDGQHVFLQVLWLYSEWVFKINAVWGCPRDHPDISSKNESERPAEQAEQQQWTQNNKLHAKYIVGKTLKCKSVFSYI